MSAGVTYGSFYALSTFFPGIAIRVAFYCAGTAALLVISSQLVSVRLADVLRELITNAFSKYFLTVTSYEWHDYRVSGLRLAHS